MTTTYSKVSVTPKICRKRLIRKNFPAFTAILGMLLTIGAAGGADTAPLHQTFLLMLLGLGLMFYAEKSATRRRFR